MKSDFFSLKWKKKNIGCYLRMVHLPWISSNSTNVGDVVGDFCVQHKSVNLNTCKEIHAELFHRPHTWLLRVLNHASDNSLTCKSYTVDNKMLPDWCLRHNLYWYWNNSTIWSYNITNHILLTHTHTLLILSFKLGIVHFCFLGAGIKLEVRMRETFFLIFLGRSLYPSFIPYILPQLRIGRSLVLQRYYFSLVSL